MNQESKIKKKYKLRDIVRKSRGFTLIELLIVVMIIGILTTLLMTNFIGIRQRARDVQRKGNLGQIQSALEMYRSDQGVYPLPGGTSGTFPTACGYNYKFTYGTSPNEIVYLQKIPCDPLSNSPYTYSSDGKIYSISACLENSNDSQIDTDVGNNKLHCSGNNSALWLYTLQNP